MSAELDLSPAIEAAAEELHARFHADRCTCDGTGRSADPRAAAAVRAAAPLIEAEVRRKVAEEIRAAKEDGKGHVATFWAENERCAKLAETGRPSMIIQRKPMPQREQQPIVSGDDRQNDWAQTYRDAGYEFCRPCGEWHRPPECPIDEQGRGINLFTGEPWAAAESGGQP